MGDSMVGPTGLEPVASSVSGKRSSRTELRARYSINWRSAAWRRRPELNRSDGFCRPAPNHSATSPASELEAPGRPGPLGLPGLPETGAEDGARTRDLNLGKVALYQLSYFRESDNCKPAWLIGHPPLRHPSSKPPVLPNPDMPRSESESSSTSSNLTSGMATITS